LLSYHFIYNLALQIYKNSPNNSPETKKQGNKQQGNKVQGTRNKEQGARYKQQATGRQAKKK
jgi:hypothetical protein